MSLFAVILAFAAAPAAPDVCGESAPPTKQERFEQRVREGQAFRRRAGMPASRAVVLRALRHRPRRLDWGVPMTRQEIRFMDRRGRTTSTEAWKRIAQYGRRHRATFGGLSVAGDFPRGGAAVMRFTERVAHHRRALRPLAPFPVRVRRVEYSERRLRRVQRGIDHRALEDEGIRIGGMGVDIDRSRVVVEYLSERDDADRLIRHEFGPLVVGKRIARKLTSLVCVKVESAEVEGAALTLSYTTNSAYEFERVYLVEERNRVRIAIVERAPNGPVTLMAAHRTAEATLSQPLGDRELVHAQSGRPVRVAD